MESKEIFFLRHGDTGMTGRYIGSTNIGLSDVGVGQVEKSGLLLQKETIQRTLCSPLLRCRQSYELLDLECQCDVVEELREVDFGLWEGKSFTEIVKQDKKLVDSWVEAPEKFSFPGGESLLDFRRRLEDFVGKLENITEKRLLIVAHGGVIRHILCLLLGLSFDNYILFNVQPGRFSTVTLYPEGGVLNGFNLGGSSWPK